MPREFLKLIRDRGFNIGVRHANGIFNRVNQRSIFQHAFMEGENFRGVRAKLALGVLAKLRQGAQRMLERLMQAINFPGDFFF